MVAGWLPLGDARPRRHLDRRLPNSKLDLVEAGHFTWEDAADTYTDLVTSWWAGGHAKALTPS